jgi:phospholipase/carboxylesterase
LPFPEKYALLNTYEIDPHQPAQACVIWMHGLGADAQDMIGLVEQLPVSAPLRHVFIDAPVRPVTLNNSIPMRAWYDILGMKITDREDQKGITNSEVLINEVINHQLTKGFSSEQIFLAGFSQGGAMALYVGLNNAFAIGGIISLSAYLPLASQFQAKQVKSTPIFMAYGKYDPIVLPNWTMQSFQWLKGNEYEQTILNEYPMEHSICMNEVIDVAKWLDTQVDSFVSDGEVE